MTLTPEQFNQLLTKEDAKNFVTKDDLGEVKREIISILEDIVTNIKDIKIEQTANIGAHDRFGLLFKDHEERIKKLEIEAV